jgi:hypothetical protein
VEANLRKTKRYTAFEEKNNGAREVNVMDI